MAKTEAIRPSESKAVKALIDAGIIPAECTRFELVLDAHDVIRAKSEFLVSEEKMQTIATALCDHPDEAKRIVQTAQYIVDARGILDPAGVAAVVAKAQRAQGRFHQ